MAATTISGLRRNIKNVAHNYTDAQVKVRAATSNDPWGPSSTQMCEIADLTYNVIAFSEIMQMIWKRINDSGKNWRHVYKALVLLEYLIKTGSEKVAAQCKENLFSIQTLKDFQFIEENKDQGLNVREKAKSLVALLKDDERLKNERVRALKAKERFSQSTAGIGSDTAFMVGGDPTLALPEHRPDDIPRSEVEMARPQTSGEEELQLQLALAMSREEAETEESKKKSDDMRLTLAIQKSKEENATMPAAASAGDRKNALDDLVDLNFGNPAPPQRTAASLDPWSPAGAADPWGAAAKPPQADPWMAGPPPAVSPTPPAFIPSPARAPAPAPAADPWGAQPGLQSGGGLADPWGGAAAGPPPASTSPQPWGGVSPAHTSPAKQDPFSPPGGGSTDLLAAFGGGAASLSSSHSPSRTQTQGSNPWDMSGLDPLGGGGLDLLAAQPLPTHQNGARPKNSVEALLGDHKDLVNLDNLVKPKQTNSARNPFAEQPNPFQAEEQPSNPFQAAAAPKPTINQLREGGNPQINGTGSSGGWPDSGQQQDINPFF